jgi:hypothetical protein
MKRGRCFGSDDVITEFAGYSPAAEVGGGGRGNEIVRMTEVVDIFLRNLVRTGD